MHSTLNHPNPYVISFWELDLNWAENVTYDLLVNVYNRFLESHNHMIQDGVNPTFDIKVKEAAMNYLMEFYSLKPNNMLVK
jgi:hypothetical protein